MNVIRNMMSNFLRTVMSNFSRTFSSDSVRFGGLWHSGLVCNVLTSPYPSPAKQFGEGTATGCTILAIIRPDVESQFGSFPRFGEVRRGSNVVNEKFLLLSTKVTVQPFPPVECPRLFVDVSKLRRAEQLPTKSDRTSFFSSSNSCSMYLCLLVTIFLLTACGSSADPTPEPPTIAPVVESVAPTDSTVTIMAMGDSLTEGFGLDNPAKEAYPSQLEARLLADGYDVRVINAGISGETSSGARSRIDWLLQQAPDIVILETGGNDGLRGIDPAVTAQNVDELVALFREQGITVVLAGMQIVQNMGAEYVEEFRTIYPTVAEKHNAILIPFFLDGVGGVPALNQPDEIHPTAEGYAVVIETIYPYVVNALALQSAAE